jgi:hypothetical protein
MELYIAAAIALCLIFVIIAGIICKRTCKKDDDYFERYSSEKDINTEIECN